MMPALIATSPVSPNWGWIVPVAGLLIGGSLIVKSILDGRTAKASVGWPSVPGTVVFSGMVEDRQADSASSSPLVTYSYIVNGQILEGSRVRFSGVQTRKILAQYPKGNTVQVFFDPQRPSNAVLEKGGSTRVMLFVGVAVIVGACAMGLVLG
jgi:Protein of unknown function (DUF3592)